MDGYVVSEQDFVATQTIRSHRSAHDGTTRRYLFTGLLRCGPCGRRLESHWINQRPGYRCRHGHTSTQQPTDRRPPTQDPLPQGKTTSSPDSPTIPASPAASRLHMTWSHSCTRERSPSSATRSIAH
ncbi:zinc ribbon domain-containing protein [Micromonospora sp. NPDC005172]|uniref:zinc ribbon domain-containing protein n=1 Tax=Micromonospora sp. NPDC005172 TaxID=3156867 RepID=UPI0033BDF7B8